MAKNAFFSTKAKNRVNCIIMEVIVNATTGESCLLYFPKPAGNTPFLAAEDGTSLVIIVHANQAPRIEIITPRLN